MPRNPADTAPRFLAPAIDPDAGEVELPREEAHHLTKVLRLGAGALVRVFDGRGREFTATVTTARGRHVRLALGGALPAPEAQLVRVTLIVSVLKGEAMDHVVRDATMMGVSEIQPIVSAHVAVKPAVALRPGSTERWRRIAIASAKQSRRATIPEVRETVPLADALASIHGSALICVEPTASFGPAPARALFGMPRPESVSLLVGPEGGWGDDEVAAAVAAGARPVSLGPLTLRADAVPVAALALLTAAWG